MAKTTSKRKLAKKKGCRVERDSLGERHIPLKAYYGIQTLRASENFPISGLRARPVFIRATAMVKLSAARANVELGWLKKRTGMAIIRASKEVIDGKLHGEFIVDVFQAGAGTSHNMNTNEVIANRAAEMLGGKRGAYDLVHPNDDVNMAQSTNDTFPTSMRIAALLETPALISSLKALCGELAKKSRKFDKVIKSGRTHLQDAVPVRLGTEFASYETAVAKARARIEAAALELKLLPLGATAAGTGVNSHPSYRRKAISALKEVSAIKGLKPSPDMMEGLNSFGDFVALSGAMRGLAVELARIANDLRLLSSGPNTGLSEIKLPPVQPGSSIMPGKVNPVMAEMLDMVSFHVMGNDQAILLAAGAGQMELNVMGPLINHNILESIEILTTSINAFTEKCVKGITADRKRCKEYFESSAGLATMLAPYIGYEEAARLVKEAEVRGVTVVELIKMSGILTPREIKSFFHPMRLTAPAKRR